jgi:hypothetical protein
MSVFKVHETPGRNVNPPSPREADCEDAAPPGVPADKVCGMPGCVPDVMDSPQIPWPAVQPGDPTEPDTAHKPMRLTK